MTVSEQINLIIDYQEKNPKSDNWDDAFGKRDEERFNLMHNKLFQFIEETEHIVETFKKIRDWFSDFDAPINNHEWLQILYWTGGYVKNKIDSVKDSKGIKIHMSVQEAIRLESLLDTISGDGAKGVLMDSDIESTRKEKTLKAMNEIQKLHYIVKKNITEQVNVNHVLEILDSL